MNTNRETHFVTRRAFCLWAISGTVPLLLGGTMQAQQKPAINPTPPVFSGKDVLCRNPAYIFSNENGQTCLRTTTKDGQRIVFGIDAGGLAVWNALPGPADIEAKRGHTVEQVTTTVIAAFPKMTPIKVKEGVQAFLAQAVDAGVVLPTDKTVFCRIETNQVGPK